MKLENEKNDIPRSISFHGGVLGAIFPFMIFIAGVVAIALSGAPDERGFWPVLILAIAAGLLLAKDRDAYSQTIIDGMSQRIVMIMIIAWILASIIGVLMTITGFVEALTWVCSQLHLNGTGFIMATFIICCIVSLSTGSSFATILICSPILYPSGGLIDAHLPTLAGAILGGATFGDFIAPISDTTIASALSQKVSIGPTVKSRIKYIAPAVLIAAVCFFLSSSLAVETHGYSGPQLTGSIKGLPMLLVPVVIIVLFLKGKHLIHGLLLGLLFGVILGLSLGLLQIDQLLSLDLDNFSAKSFVIDGINRTVGISFFTILLMGLVATLKASGIIDQLVDFAARRSKTPMHGEAWIASVVSAAVLLTTHSVVAILMVAEFAERTGERVDIKGTRRANILSLVACVFPFLLPYFIPVILMANMTKTGTEFGIPAVTPLYIGIHNFISWALLAVVVLVIIFGFGRRDDQASQEKMMT